ncbi:MAG: alpha-mannosidase, partial [Lachnospiraceae bacterium]|nr:alpha-mannosidase [Lachnospiraceae bacterium]
MEEGGECYFNTLNQKREEVTFIPWKEGPVTRKGVKGYYIDPEMEALSGKELSWDGDTDISWFHAEGLNVETPLYRIRFGEDGSIESLFDKEMSREWTGGNFNKLHIYQDTPGMYDAWDILPNYKDVEYAFTVEESLHFAYGDGKVAEFTASLKTPKEKSTWKMIIRMFKDSPAIEVEHIVDWDEKHKMVKAEFACNVLSRELVCDTSAGYIRRETHKNTSWQKARFEVCHHKWCDFAEKGGGIAIINEGKYGLGVEENGMSLSLIRSNIRPDILSDIGHHDFCYMILPHKGDAVEAQINRKAFAYNVPLVKAAVKGSDLDFGPLYLQAAKLSENGKYVVFRLSEQDGFRGVVKLPFKGCLMN